MSRSSIFQQKLFGAPVKQDGTSRSGDTPSSLPIWTIHIDGASRGNPGSSGAGIYVYDKSNAKVIAKEAFFLGDKTNNQAEYLALALAVIFVRRRMLAEGFNKLHLSIISDSELLIKQMKGLYRVKNPQLLQIKLVVDRLLSGVGHSFTHVLRAYNKVADELANQGIDRKRMVPDELREALKNTIISLPS